MIDSWNGSIYLSPSSSSSSIVPSPLPSPTPSASSKTHAFFSSPFEYAAPLPPPSLHSRSVSSRTDSSSEESSSSASSVEVLESATSEIDHIQIDSDDTPKLQHQFPPPFPASSPSHGTPLAPTPVPPLSEATPTVVPPPAIKSLNADFFRPSTLPTPPPSIRSFSAASSRDNSPPPGRPRERVLPPIERFFPSRGVRAEGSRETSAERREFMLLGDGDVGLKREGAWGRYPTAPMPPAPFPVRGFDNTQLQILAATSPSTTTTPTPITVFPPEDNTKEAKSVGYVTKMQMTTSPVEAVFSSPEPTVPVPVPVAPTAETYVEPNVSVQLTPGLVIHPTPSTSTSAPTSIATSAPFISGPASSSTFLPSELSSGLASELDTTYAPPPQPESKSTPSPSLTLVRPLGQGAFSSVWLARDAHGELEMEGETKRRRSLLRRGSSKRKTRKSSGYRSVSGSVKIKGEVGGLRPAGVNGGGLLAEPELDEGAEDVKVNGEMERARTLEGKSAKRKEGRSRLVAVKMTERSVCERDTRTRVSFVREVEVLRVSLYMRLFYRAPSSWALIHWTTAHFASFYHRLSRCIQHTFAPRARP